MRLIKPPFPDLTGTGLYYCTQAGHRKTAINLAIAALRGLPNYSSDEVFTEMGEAMREWTIAAVIQGAWVREYHKWETDTKSYFNVMYERNSETAPNWQKLTGSHVGKIEKQLPLFSATPPASLTEIEEARDRINDTKHEDSYLATQSDYECLTTAVDRFWQSLNTQEIFSPPARKS
jgi:hypothetical protein